MYSFFQDICRNITCYPPRIYQDGACIGPYTYVSGVSYRLYIKFTPTRQFDLDEGKSLQDGIVAFLDKQRERLEIPRKSQFLRLFLKPAGVKHDVTALNYYYLAEVNITISAIYTLRETVIDDILALDNVTVSVGRPSMIRQSDFRISFVIADPQPSDDPNDYYYFDRDTLFYDSVQGETLILLGPTDFDRDGTRNARDTDPILHELVNGDEETKAEAMEWMEDTDEPKPVGSTLSEETTEAEIMIPPKVCPLVAFSVSDLDIEWFSWGIVIKDIAMNISVARFIDIPSESNENGTIYMCKDLFINTTNALMNKFKLQVPDNVENLTQGILSFVCTCLSVVCSLLTVAVYALFRELRTQPGVNNVMLSLSLICAQLLFQFGVLQVDKVSQWACRAIGAMVHFLWLLTLMWMNVCSLHMFRVFKSLRQKSIGTSLVSTTLAYAGYCAVCALIPVVANAVVSSVYTGGVGYGGSLCYISDTRMVLYTFVIPVAAIVLANIILFVSVVVIITRMPKLDTERTRNRNLAKIYLKLSTITGSTWLFSFLYYFTGEVVVEYIAIVLNAGIGLFIFLAFVCNKRVLNLLSALCRPSKAKYDAETTKGTSVADSPTK